MKHLANYSHDFLSQVIKSAFKNLGHGPKPPPPQYLHPPYASDVSGYTSSASACTYIRAYTFGPAMGLLNASLVLIWPSVWLLQALLLLAHTCIHIWASYGPVKHIPRPAINVAHFGSVSGFFSLSPAAPYA